jgi:hypothetical protein
MKAAERYAEAERMYNPKKRAVEQISIPTNATDDPVMVKIIQEAPTQELNHPVQISVEAKNAEIKVEAQPETSLSTPSETLPALSLFRIPSWEAAELSYLTLAVQNLNNLARSYNLMAPDLAKKPYFSLDRELKSCYADIAPQLAEEIKQRAARPAEQFVEKIGHRPGGVLERFSREDRSVIYDSKRPPYGFKEFWNDLFRKEKNA